MDEINLFSYSSILFHSVHRITEMNLETVLFRFTILFNILGQNCCTSHETFRTHKKSFYRIENIKIIPSILSIFLIIFITSVQLFYILVMADYPGIDDLILTIFLASVALTMLCGSIQSILFHRKFLQIFILLKQIEQMLLMKFKPDFEHFSKRFKKLLLITILFKLVAVFITFFMFTSRFVDFVVNCSLYSFAACTEIQIIHVLFYIELLHSLMKIITNYVNEMTMDDRHHFGQQLKVIKVHDEINYLKVLHYNLWKLTRIINQTFSLTLVSIPLQYFANSVYCINYVIVQIITPEMSIEAIRKTN